MKRIFFLTLGCLFTAVGIVGLFLPLIPTTSPLLLAAWCFAKSSRTFHDWLVNHKYLGKYIHDLWVRGGLTKKSKLRAIIAMSFFLLLSAIFLPWIVRLCLIGVWIIAATFILTRKTLLPLNSPKTNEKKMAICPSPEK